MSDLEFRELDPNKIYAVNSDWPLSDAARKSIVERCAGNSIRVIVCDPALEFVELSPERRYLVKLPAIPDHQKAIILKELQGFGLRAVVVEDGIEIQQAA
jgi:hypothetical protein